MLNKIKNFVKNKSLELILAGTLALTLTACKPPKRPTPINQAPQITTASLQNAVENKSYSALVQATDPNNDPLTYSITGGTGDAFLTINPSTGGITNDSIITDMESGINHTLTVRATDDKGKFDEKGFLFYVVNTENVTGNIKNVTNNNNLSGMQVKIGSNSALTNVNGNYTLTDVEDGIYDTEINDNTGSETNYFTHKAGKLITNKQKNLENKLNNINLKLIPTSLEAGDTRSLVLQAINESIRTWYYPDGHAIKKWQTCPTFRIYLRDSNIGNLVDPANIILARNWINRLYEIDPLFNNPIIQEVDSTRPVGDTSQGYFDINWNSSLAALGLNSNWFNNNEIIAGYALFNTSENGVYGQEITEGAIGGSETNTYSPMITNDPLTTNNYETMDYKLLRDIRNNRPAGNKDLGTSNNHDVNPSDYIINP